MDYITLVKKHAGTPLEPKPSPLWRIICATLCGLALWALIGYAFYYALTLPIVYEAYPSGECVRVDDVEGRYTCDNMPTKYHHEWVMQER